MGNNHDQKKFVERRKNRSSAQNSLFSELRPEPIKPLNFFKQYARWVMAFSLGLSDVTSIVVSFGLVYFMQILLSGNTSTAIIKNIYIFIPITIFIYAWNGLYPGVGLSPVDEIRKLSIATNFSFLIMLAITFFEQLPYQSSILFIGASWFISRLLVQLNRWVLRIIGRDLGFWGEPVTGWLPVRYLILSKKDLKDNLRLGMRPYVMLSGKSNLDKAVLDHINYSKISTAILVIPEMSEKLQRSFIYEQRHGHHRRKGEKPIDRLILISSLSWVGSLGVDTHDLGGILGLEVRQNLLNKWAKFLKRSLDLILTITGCVLLSPLIPILFLVITLDSRGGIFYKQERLGRDGKKFGILKLRTMVANADSILEEYLEKHPELRAEWESSHKLKNDPRITRIGNFLRKFSIDELPQLWNVLKGEMSLVGPRPIVTDETRYYGPVYKLYKQVNPGMTGIWQISGRSDTGYEQRVNLDEYYIRNWSLWLDIYIIVRTLYIVISKKGAY